MSHLRSVASLVCVVLLASALGSAWASPAGSRVLGLSHRLISAGATLTVELTVKPKRDFDRIVVEAGSGVKTLSPECRFDGVTANAPYVCRLEVSGTPSDAFMTLNVVGTNVPAGGGLAQTEIQHLTFKNAAFRKAVPTASFHSLAHP